MPSSISNCFLAPSLAGGTREFFFNIQREIQVELLEVKLTIVPTHFTSLHNWVLWTCWTHRLVPIEPQQFANYNSGFPTQAGPGSLGGFCLWVSTPVSCDSLYLPVSPISQGSDLPCDLIFVINQRGVVYFSACAAFTCC